MKQYGIIITKKNLGVKKMRIEKREVIYLSQEEADTWDVFDKILEEIEEKSNDPYIISIIGEITGNLSDLLELVEIE